MAATLGCALLPLRAHAAGRVAIPPVAGLPGRDNKPPPADIVGAADARLRSAVSAAGFDVVDWAADPAAAASRPSIPDDIAVLLERAATAARTMQHVDAVRDWNQAIDLLQTRIVEVGDVTPLWQAHIDLAAAYLALEEPELAAVQTGKAIRLVPVAELDPRKYAPALVAAYTETYTRVAAEPRASIEIDVGVRGAAVSLDGVVVAEAPGTLKVYQGPHLLQLSAPGYQTARIALNAVVGSMLKVQQPLLRLPAADVVTALQRELIGDARASVGLQLAQELAQLTRADATLVAGVVPLPAGGYAVLARLTGNPARALVCTFLVPGPAIDALAQRLRTPAPVNAVQPEVVVGAPDAPSLAALPLDFERHLLGLAPAAAPTTRSAAPVVATADEPPADAPGLLQSPWLWGVVGAAALAAAAAAGVGIYYLLQPGVEQQVLPDELTVSVESVP